VKKGQDPFEEFDAFNMRESRVDLGNSQSNFAGRRNSRLGSTHILPPKLEEFEKEVNIGERVKHFNFRYDADEDDGLGLFDVLEEIYNELGIRFSFKERKIRDTITRKKAKYK